MIDWSPRYEIGIRLIDRQHRQIVDIINELYHLDSSRERGVMRDVFAKLMHYFETHFRDEEDLMEKNAYPGFALQKKEHDAFIDTICGYHREFLKGQALVPINVFNAVWDWFAHHIVKVDAEFQPFAVEKKIR
jgi:hemerythrin-like metal-binding protein